MVCISDTPCRGYNAEVVRMKKQKLQLKDEMLKILQQESVKEV